MDKNSTTATVATNSNIRPRRRIMQNFLLLWLDAHIDESNKDFHHSITQLQRIVNTVYTFTDPDECVTFLTKISTEKAFMIVSGALCHSTVPRIHEISELDCIFVFCRNKSYHEQWAKEWSKVKGVFTQITHICDSIQQAARQCEQDSIPMSFHSASSAGASNQSLDQLDQSFMYTQLFKEILLEIDSDTARSIKELAAYCCEQNINNDEITKFEQEYRLQSPIWWYTCECFLYRMLNRALRTLEVDTLLKQGFFIRHLHRHIDELYRKQSGQRHHQFTVYRGQGLPKAEFEKLKRTRGGLMSFNNFLSTSKERDIAIGFARDSLSNSNSVGILFRMIIDPAISSTPFVFLNKEISAIPKEQEILFSTHTIFRTGEVKQVDGNNRLWQVELTMTADKDPQLTALTTRMRAETFEGYKGEYRLGKLLIKLGKFDQAEQLYRMLLYQTSNDCDKAHLYHMLGWIKSEQGEYKESISFYEKALEIKQKTLPPNHTNLAASYNDIGTVHYKQGESLKALPFYEKALEIDRKNLPPNHPRLALEYSNIGNVYDSMGEYSKALLYYEKSLKIYKQHLSPNDPSLANSYHNIGSVYDNMREYSRALSYLQQAIAIKENTLPSNHPSLADSYHTIGMVYMNMGNYPKALSFYEKARDIREKALHANHLDLAISYNNIGQLYSKMNEYEKALSYLGKARDIQEKTLPRNHSDFAVSFFDIGYVYENKGEYPKAVSFYERAVDIGQHSLPTNNPQLQRYRKHLEHVRKKL